jgi:hypothetical protein
MSFGDDTLDHPMNATTVTITVCRTNAHIKSGGCWTAKYAHREYGKPAVWHVL